MLFPSCRLSCRTCGASDRRHGRSIGLGRLPVQCPMCFEAAPSADPCLCDAGRYRKSSGAALLGLSCRQAWRRGGVETAGASTSPPRPHCIHNTHAAAATALQPPYSPTRRAPVHQYCRHGDAQLAHHQHRRPRPRLPRQLRPEHPHARCCARLYSRCTGTHWPDTPAPQRRRQ